MSLDAVLVDLDPRIGAAVRKSPLKSPADVLHQSVPELERLTKLAKQDVLKLVSSVSLSVLRHRSIPASGVPACSMRAQGSRLTLACPILDDFLRGGLLTRGITEIAGESSSGKSQLCLQLLLSVQLPVKYGGLAGGAAYLATESAFPEKRLEQMKRSFVARWKKHDLASFRERIPTGEMSDNIFIHHLGAVDELYNVVLYQLERLLQQQNIKLIVVDSIAALFRGEFELSQSSQKSKYLGRIGCHLKLLSEKYSLPVVCVNQVSDYFKPETVDDDPNAHLLASPAARQSDAQSAFACSSRSQSLFAPRSESAGGTETLGGGSSRAGSADSAEPSPPLSSLSSLSLPSSSAFSSFSSFASVHSASRSASIYAASGDGSAGLSSGSIVVPALGLAWSNLVNVRILLKRLSASGQDGDVSGTAGVPRLMHVAFAPHVPASSCTFVVDQDGVKGVVL